MKRRTTTDHCLKGLRDIFPQIFHQIFYQFSHQTSHLNNVLFFIILSLRFIFCVEIRSIKIVDQLLVGIQDICMQISLNEYHDIFVFCTSVNFLEGSFSHYWATNNVNLTDGNLS